MGLESRIFIVDDDPIERENLEDLLGPIGYVLGFAANGREALEKVVDFSPDLILLDVMMPGMNGYDVCRELREARATAEVPIILVTALNDRDSRLEGIEAGADDFISKPFDSVELRARVRSITRLNRYRLLLAERAKFERVVEHAQTGYLLLDKDDQILFSNPTASRYLNLEGENGEVRNETFLVLAKKQYRCEPTEAWTTWPEKFVDNNYRYLILPESQTSQTMWLQVDILEFLANGPNPTRIVSLSDVTKQMDSHRERRNFHKLVTHKLRTPFISILTGLEILIKHIDTLSHEEISEVATDAYKWAKRLYEDVEEVLSYAESPLHAESDKGFNLALLPVLIANVSDSMGLNNMSVSIADGLMGVRAAIGKPALEAIFYETFSNSKKFHPENRPTIDVVIAYEGFGEVGILISDDGLTLSPGQLEQVWTPYYQGEKYFTGMVEGMGLGLSLVASLVWSIGGRCRLYNRVGRSGVTLDLTLPCQVHEILTETADLVKPFTS